MGGKSLSPGPTATAGAAANAAYYKPPRWGVGIQFSCLCALGGSDAQSRMSSIGCHDNLSGQSEWRQLSPS